MQKTLLLFIFIFLSITTYGQVKGIRLMPEGGLSLPSGEFKDPNVFAGNGIQAGLNLDAMFGKFGLGLYGGIDKNKIKFEDGLPVNTNGLVPSKSSQGSSYSWDQVLVGLGPILQLKISEKFNFEISPKIGFSKFSYPHFEQSIDVTAPLNQEYLLYKTKNEDIDKKFNTMFLSSARLNFKVSKKIGLALGANYKNVQGVLHSYTYLDGGFNPGMSNEEIVAALRTRPMVTDLRKCNFNSIGVTLGVSFNLGGGKDKPKDEQKDDVKMEPPIPQYPPDGATITVEEADSLVLKWVKETPNVDKANYNLWLYEVRDSTRKHDSLIYKTKVERSLKFLLPENVKLIPDSTYRYEVQAVDDQRLKPCPGDCYSVDATFTISNIIDFQYYHLLTQNAGSYVEIENRLNFTIPDDLETGGRVEARIYNDSSEIIMLLENLTSNTKAENYSVDAQGIVSIPINRFDAGYYVLQVKNERNRDYFLRFLIASHNANDKE